MPQRRLVFEMPAEAEVVFDAFHHHEWRLRWDSLVRATHVLGGAAQPFVGAVTENLGAGTLRGLAMRTQFISYDRPRVAAAQMIGRSFPFSRWAASMRHRPLAALRSELIYIYNFDVEPAALKGLLGPIVEGVFVLQTRRRFRRLSRFLARHAHEVRRWQLEKLEQSGAA
jgi:hypothetical protein